MVVRLVRLASLALLQLVAAGLDSDLNDLHGLPDRIVKEWKPSLLFSEPDNWEGGALPCPGDRVVFPRDLKGAPAYVSAGGEDSRIVEVREMQLPWLGTIVLGDEGSVERNRFGILIPDNRDSDSGRRSSLIIGGEESRSRACPGRDVRWRGSPLRSWLDPGAWKPANLFVEPKDLEATPHLERIPCGQDVAVFKDVAFQIKLPDFPVRVAAVAVGNNVYFSGGRARLDRRLRSNVVSDRRVIWVFRHGMMSATQVMAGSAQDLARLGEQCGLGVEDDAYGAQQERAPDQGQVYADELAAAVCRHVTCPVPHCDTPVRPHLHCCYVCGAVLELEPLPDRDLLERVRKAALHAALRYEKAWGAGAAPGVHVGGVPSPIGRPGLAQIVFLGENAEDLAADVLADIQSFVGSRFETRLLVSGALMAPASVGSVLAVLVGSLFLVLVAMAAIVHSHYGALPLQSRLGGLFLSEKEASFLFARFENSAEENGVEVRVAGGPQQPGVPGVRSARGSWSARSFRNPLFEQEQPDEADEHPSYEQLSDLDLHSFNH
ncbi:Protein amnionless [Frankliniella fusca]|uniref:Protein amnionless n=1 Tax=Frankliniella fusca TaxID=407009 RepID=A0AAE1HL24_9NEOP|nr:Protein amnionless [Frankliniella fusca]